MQLVSLLTVMGERWQNYWIDEAIVYGGISYEFVPFGITSGAGASGGDRSEEQLVLPLTELAANMVTEAVRAKAVVIVETVLIDPVTNQIVGSFSEGRWRIRSYSQDVQAITVQLSSPFDAVTTGFPKELLTTSKVGILPVQTGQALR